MAPSDDYFDYFKPVEIKVLNNNFETALKKFKSLVQKEKIIVLYKEKMSYEKPSEKIRRRQREAVERQRQASLKEEQIKSGEWEKIEQRREKKRQLKIQRKMEENNGNITSSE